MQVLPAATRAWVAWKNGGGLTSEVATGPDGVVDFDWRVSIARIERDGPFSMFPGTDRTLRVLSGGPLILTPAGREVALHPGSDPIEFDGAELVEARIVSATTVLNLMARRGRQGHEPETLVLALRPVTFGGMSLYALDAVRFAPGESVPPASATDAIHLKL